MLIIPNATETTGGNRYAALDQAEPDSLDFEILGNVGRSGVISGCAVSSNNSSTNVRVASGYVYLNGAVYEVESVPTQALPAAPAENRFDLIVVRTVAGTASVVVISGDSHATNPRFPLSRSVLSSGVAYSSATHVDLEAEVVLAAVYRNGAAAVESSHIVDKRAMQSSGIALQGPDAPTAIDGTGPGNLYFKNNTVDGDGTDSGVYVKLANSQWIPLAKDIGLHLPIGGMIEWPTSAPVPSRFAEATGQGLSKDVYPTLFDLYRYEHGGSGTTFLLPDYRNVHKRGTANLSLVGTTVGADSLTLSESQLPSHTHPNPHSHTMPHTHGISHDHTGTSAPEGAHSHTPGTLAVTGNAGLNPALRVPTYADVGINPVYITGYIAPGGSIPDAFAGGMVLQHTSSALVTTGATSLQNAHTHTITVDQHTGSTISQSTSSTSPADVTPTGSTGGGAPISTIPATRYVRNIIRVS